jgi:Sulfatase
MSTAEAALPDEGGAASSARAPRVTLKQALWAFLNLAVLWTFAVAQPLFDLLKDNPEFFAARGSSGGDVISFSVLLVVLPPLLLLAIELLLGLLGRRVREGAHVAFIGVLMALIAAQALKKAFDASDVVLIVLSLAIGAGVAALWARAEAVRSFLNVLSPAPLVFLALFLFTAPISKLAFPDDAEARTIGGVTNTPIVVILLDELPALSLMDANHEIDAKRFPGFAELAKRATWFPNAYSIYDSTERAQPAIMDGNYPEKDHLPTSSDHPNSIFTLFGKTHRMHVSEEATSVCPPDLCEDTRPEESYADRMGSMSEDLGLVWLHVVSPPEIEKDLASVSENWGNFGGQEDGATEQPATDDTGAQADQQGEAQNVIANLNANRKNRFEAWIAGIENGQRPELDFKHALLPHVPWQYLPDGRRYRTTPNDSVPGLSTQAYEYEQQRDVLLQRHLLQLGFADHLLQQLWQKLRQDGTFDKALIVVAADHGVALQKARRDRRRLKPDTVGEIASIPLLIKAPGQKRGKVDDAYVETVDILPTIFDLLNVDPKVKMDGSSAFSEKVQSRDELRMFLRNNFEPLKVSPAEFQRQRKAALDHKLKVLGTGAEGPDRIYRIGPHQELLGTSVSSLSPAPRGELRAELQDGDVYDDVDTKTDFLPTHPVATVSGGQAGQVHDVAIAVNGRIAAVSKTFYLATDESQELISAMIPPESLRNGKNAVELFVVQPDGGLQAL